LVAGKYPKGAKYPERVSNPAGLTDYSNLISGIKEHPLRNNDSGSALSLDATFLSAKSDIISAKIAVPSMPTVV
jgi:hypothetical protein